MLDIVSIRKIDLPCASCRAICYLACLEQQHHFNASFATLFRDLLHKQPLHIREIPSFLRDLANATTKASERLRILQESLEFANLCGIADRSGSVSASESFFLLNEQLRVATALLARLNLCLEAEDNTQTIERIKDQIEIDDVALANLLSKDPSQWLKSISDLKLLWVDPDQDVQSSLQKQKLRKEALNQEARLLTYIREYLQLRESTPATLRDLVRNPVKARGSPTKSAHSSPPATIHWNTSLEDSVRASELQDLCSISSDIATLNALHARLAEEVESQGGCLSACEQVVGSLRTNTTEAKQELAVAAERKSQSWIYELGAIGVVLGAIAGVVAGPPGALLGGAAGAALGSVTGSALKNRRKEQLRSIARGGDAEIEAEVSREEVRRAGAGAEEGRVGRVQCSRRLVLGGGGLALQFNQAFLNRNG